MSTLRKVITACAALGVLAAAPAFACGFKTYAAPIVPRQGDIVGTSAVKNTRVIMLSLNGVVDPELGRALRDKGFAVSDVDQAAKLNEAAKQGNNQHVIVLTRLSEVDSVRKAMPSAIVVPVLSADGQQVDKQQYPVALRSNGSLRDSLMAIDEVMKKQNAPLS